MPAWSGTRAPSDYLHPKKRDRVLAAHGHTCYLCGHGGGTLEVDHVIPFAEWTRVDLSVHDASNLRPAHGTPCPTCARDCHADKTKQEAARGRARAQTKRKAQATRPQEQHPGNISYMR